MPDLLSPWPQREVTITIRTPGMQTMEFTGLQGEVSLDLEWDEPPSYPHSLVTPKLKSFTMAVKSPLADSIGHYYTVRVYDEPTKEPDA